MEVTPGVAAGVAGWSGVDGGHQMNGGLLTINGATMSDRMEFEDSILSGRKMMAG